MPKNAILYVPILGILSAWPAAADTVQLENGDRLSGTVKGFDGKSLTFETDYAGIIKLSADLIANIATDGPVAVRIHGIGWTTGRLTSDDSGTIRVVRDDSTASALVALGAIDRLHPGRDIPLGFQWRGRVNAGATERSGNTDSRAFHLDTEITGRAEKDRIRLRGELNREFDNGERSADDFLASVQYDRFVSEKVFLYTTGKLERDTPADLRLRTTVGAGAGYQFIETETTTLSLSAGPAYVNENFETSPDDDYIALTWGADFEYVVWDSIAELFHHHEGTVDASDAGNYVITSSTGVRFPFGQGLNATAQVDVDYDNRPAPGVSPASTRRI